MGVESDTVYDMEKGWPVQVTRLVDNAPLGDGKAEFLGPDMTEEEYYEHMRDDENGWKNLKNRLFGKKT
jgi:hypothetical protein